MSNLWEQLRSTNIKTNILQAKMFCRHQKEAEGTQTASSSLKLRAHIWACNSESKPSST